MTPFQKHKLRWQSCERCDLCQTRDKTCLVRGKLPADVLFVGEAPGPSEDVIGQPFIGPAGHLLDEIIAEAIDHIPILCSTCGKPQFNSPSGYVCDNGHGGADSKEASLRIAFTNLVACIPKSEDTGEKFTEPPEYAIKKCAPRLIELIAITSPRLIVCVGKLSEIFVPALIKMTVEKAFGRGSRLNVKIVKLVHPAAILRADVSQRSLAIKRCIVTLSEAFTKLVST